MAQKPSIPKGTRDFGHAETAERNYIFDTVSRVFRKYGYAQIETPAMENLTTLLGKYGDEGDKLLYRILNSGDAFAGADFSQPLAPQVCEKGLRYDLTVPFARYVVQHQNEITLPFKRFQIQPVSALRRAATANSTSATWTWSAAAASSANSSSSRSWTRSTAASASGCR